MLRGNYDSVYSVGLTVNVFNGNLSLSVRTKIRKLAVLSYRSQSLCELVRKRDGQRHKLRGLIASIAEHKTLVTGSGIKSIVHFSILSLKALINSKSYISALLMNRAENSTGSSIKAILCTIITYLSNSITYYSLHVDLGLSCYLTHNSDDTCSSERLACYAALRILCDNLIEYRIGYFVTNFVGMSLGYRLRGKKHLFLHFFLPFNKKTLGTHNSRAV